MSGWLIATSLRALVLAAVAGLAMVRVRSAATRHAVWTLVTAGMLALAIAVAVLPTLPVRVMPPRPHPDVPVISLVRSSLPVPGAPPAQSTESLVISIYAIGFAFFTLRLLYACLLVRKLVRGSRA